MYTLISVAAGIVLEAVIVDRTQNRMRVIARGFSDVLELRRERQVWLTQDGEPVQFDFLADLTPTENTVVRQGHLTLNAGTAW